MEESGERSALVSNTQLVGRTTHLNTSFDCRCIYWLLILLNVT